MEIKHHPEYECYQQDAALVTACQQAVQRWVASGETIRGPGEVRWTPATARAFVTAIAGLFRRYNFVLWETFDYCRRCGGGCCVPGASQVTVFDAIAMALLAQPFPGLPAHTPEGACIYLGAGGCRWPMGWRPIKCWAFYCLGSGDWEFDAADARYAEITAALEQVVATYLPHRLQRTDELALQRFLSDPIAFAEALGAELVDLLVAPFATRYEIASWTAMADGVESSALHGAPSGVPEKALAFIAQATEGIWRELEHSQRAGDEKRLEDLERLEWIVLERPSQARAALLELLGRYGSRQEGDVIAPGASAFAAQMADVIRGLLATEDF